MAVSGSARMLATIRSKGARRASHVHAGSRRFRPRSMRPATPLIRAFSQATGKDRGIVVGGHHGHRPQLGHGDRQHARSRSPSRAAAVVAGGGAPGAPASEDSPGCSRWRPVPKAAPASTRIGRLAAGGGAADVRAVEKKPPGADRRQGALAFRHPIARLGSLPAQKDGVSMPAAFAAVAAISAVERAHAPAWHL